MACYGIVFHDFPRPTAAGFVNLKENDITGMSDSQVIFFNQSSDFFVWNYGTQICSEIAIYILSLRPADICHVYCVYLLLPHFIIDFLMCFYASMWYTGILVMFLKEFSRWVMIAAAALVITPTYSFVEVIAILINISGEAPTFLAFWATKPALRAGIGFQFIPPPAHLLYYFY